MRRKFFAVALVLGFVAAACGGSDENGNNRATPAATQPDLNATIRVGANEDVWPDQGAAVRSTLFQYVTNQNVYEPLIYLGTDYSLKPGLATWWSPQPDGRTWRFTLRQGVKFHDGTPFTADDVVWSWGPVRVRAASRRRRPTPCTARPAPSTPTRPRRSTTTPLISRR